MTVIEIFRILLSASIVVCALFTIFVGDLRKSIMGLFFSISLTGVLLILNEHAFLSISLILLSVLILVVSSSFSTLFDEEDVLEKKTSFWGYVFSLTIGFGVCAILFYCLGVEVDFERSTNLMGAGEKEIRVLGRQLLENHILTLELAGVSFLQLLVGCVLFLRKEENED